ncbi:hypothetical protein A2U01_0034959, partial [Trifolium medium]|nr:hypothetical protein [Trifolium medium]
MDDCPVSHFAGVAPPWFAFGVSPEFVSFFFSGSVIGGAPSPESSCRRSSCSVSGDWCYVGGRWLSLVLVRWSVFGLCSIWVAFCLSLPSVFLLLLVVVVMVVAIDLVVAAVFAEMWWLGGGSPDLVLTVAMLWWLGGGGEVMLRWG